MSKKGLLSSLIVSLVVALALGIYTIVSVAVGGNQAPAGPTNINAPAVAYRTDDTIDVLSGYTLEQGNITFTMSESNTELPISFDAEKGEYVATGEGEVTAVLKLDEKGNTKTINISIYRQGSGASEDDAFILANAKHLKEFADMVNEVSAERNVPAFTKLVSDVDLGELNWKPIGGEGNLAYTGTFDGNGKTIKNLNINVNEENYKDFVVANTVSGEVRGLLDLGFFGRVKDATIKNLNIADAKISVSTGVYSLVKVSESPADPEFGYIARVNIGTMVGNAYNTDIIGCENRNTVVSRIEGFSATTGIVGKTQGHGLGGLVGVAQLVRVSNYDLTVRVINGIGDANIKGSRVGGVFGRGESSYQPLFETTPSVDQKTVVNNVVVDMSVSALYSANARIGGVVGYGKNMDILNSTVESFKVVDTTYKADVDYNLEGKTLVGGVASVLVSNSANTNVEDAAVVANLASLVKDVDVQKIDVYMMGGEVSGVAHSLEGSNGLTTKVEDVTVSGGIVANIATGFAYQVYTGATVAYTKAYDKAVVDVDLSAHMSNGFACYVFGNVEGFADGEYKTQIVVDVDGLGARFNSLTTREQIVEARKATFANGFAYSIENAKVSNFDVDFEAVDSLVVSGVAYETKENAVIENVKVVSNITSYSESQYTTTYMVAGAVANAYAGTTIKDVVVDVNVNQDRTEGNKYGASFFGGLVARYYGDSETAGLTLTDNVVSGNVYFNASTESIVWDEVEYDVFVAGGLVGAIMTNVDSGVEATVDALADVSIKFTKDTFTGNIVKHLNIVVDFKDEKALSEQAWRARAIGALVGVVNSEETGIDLDLSDNKVYKVGVTADFETFVYKAQDASTISTLGYNKVNAFGVTFFKNTGAINPSVAYTEEDAENTTIIDVTYTDVQ